MTKVIITAIVSLGDGAWGHGAGWLYLLIGTLRSDLGFQERAAFPELHAMTRSTVRCMYNDTLHRSPRL